MYEVFSYEDVNLKKAVDIQSSEWTFISKFLEVPVMYWKTHTEW